MKDKLATVDASWQLKALQALEHQWASPEIGADLSNLWRSALGEVKLRFQWVHMMPWLIWRCRRREAAAEVQALYLQERDRLGVAVMGGAPFSVAELYSVGYSAAALREAGEPPATLHEAGYTAAALKVGGYTPKELCKAGGLLHECYTLGEVCFAPSFLGCGGRKLR